ncbi:hypothetical protein [Streptomyces glomeratus]|uniref:Neocarzinostatin family protein n=1 Tax=Streptomyces glomeratus TaxID=284452 RepID=A0ABP6M479_9ACTN|nr:hypothetical protein [Streptomyces glomeratus]MCF1506377.1 hypothetical protein [Streptomyces glomeratus]
MKRWIPALAAVLVLVLVPLAAPARGTGRPTVHLSASQAGAGGSITVTGTGWRPGALLTILICGQSVPSRGLTGSTDFCANADGRAVTTDARGTFRRGLPVAEPPVPCPCVVHVATVTGAGADADAALQIAGHAVEPLPAESASGRLSLLTDTRLDGADGLLTWFGAPPSRTLVFTVGNAGRSPVKDPVFRVGTSHGVFAPQWDEQRWQGTLAPGGKARIELPVDLPAGAHGDYTVSLEYGGRVLAEQPWGAGRPWGVTVFWLMVCVVVPAAVFRLGMAVVERVRPRGPAGRAVRHRGPRLPGLLPRPLGPHPSPPGPALRAATALPWFCPDTDPGGGAGADAPPPGT